MAARIAVLNNRHQASFQTIAFMLRDIGFEVYLAGESFRGILNPYGDPKANPYIKGIMEFQDMPQEALFVDTRWENESRLRKKGWNGPVLIYWLTPVSIYWITLNFHKMFRSAVLSFRPQLATALAAKGIPVDCFWPPYAGVLSRGGRTEFDPYFVFACKDAGYCVEPDILAALRDDIRIQLELYGGGNPAWSRTVSCTELFKRIRRATALCHLKHTDNAGNAVMEAVIQGVPVILRRDYIADCGAEDLFEDGITCILVKNLGIDEITEACLKLKDPNENKSIGAAAQKRFQAVADWTRNRPRFINLLSRILCADLA